MSSTRGHFEGLFGALPARPDRRAYGRSNSALLTYVELGEGNGGIALNVSEGGLAITSAELLMSDYLPSVRFQLPRSNAWIEASGQVVWTSDSKKGAGIQFVDLVESEREKIREWMATKDSANDPAEGTGETVRGTDLEFLGIRSASKLPLKDRKLETLSEADEAKFAGMFPSEKSLANVHEPETVKPDSEPRIAEQNSRNVLRFLVQGLERGEGTGTSATLEPSEDHLTQPEMASALTRDLHSVEEKTHPRPADIPVESPLTGPVLDEVCEGEQQGAGESQLAQPESAKSETPHDHPAQSESLQPADFPDENSLLTAANEFSKIEARTPGRQEQELRAYVSPEEADLIQQLELHRKNQAAKFLQEQAREVSVERRSGWPLAALVFLGGIACFAVGVGVGNGFFDRLLGREQGVEQPSGATPAPASLPAATAGENDFAGPSAVAGNAQKSVEAPSSNSAATPPPNNSAAAAPSDSHAASEFNLPAKAAPARAADTNNNDGENPATKDTQQQTETGTISPTAALPTQAAPPLGETLGPILVTAPDEKSGPFRLTLAEQAVSASPTLAISAQRSVPVPGQPGPASSHRPERLQVGVLIFHVDPQVPATGNQKEMAGTVRVRATIGKSGDVVDVKPISGPPALIPVVIKAVREWRYTVTLLDGQPLGTEEDVVVEFRPKG